MTQSPLFLNPVFQERIWGGTSLRDQFNYEISSDLTGECWAISAHPNGQSIIASGEHAGKTLGQLWDENREIFGGVEGSKFPLLTKILDANNDLSVQVHPDDEYAHTNENGELGKTECWYIIDCKEGADMIYGHTASSKEELVKMVENGEWNSLLRRVKIKPGDFFYVPSGTIHALCEGTLVLETQQSSDTTYRVYDYDRTDDKGEKRELHLEKAIEVSTVPHVDREAQPAVAQLKNVTITTFVEEEYFTVYKWEVNGQASFLKEQPFLICSVIDGDGKLVHQGETHTLSKGAHFILPAGVDEFEIDGSCSLIVSHI
ncbi:mannose-6-phosphate isomerase, class I [Metabacillus indicus]|uniref:mannose-6-phosphate isomerase, class I n=1 Tax=Metabacillus indicus TaxID=246786 RepID=UPI0039841AB1